MRWISFGLDMFNSAPTPYRKIGVHNSYTSVRIDAIQAKGANMDMTTLALIKI